MTKKKDKEKNKKNHDDEQINKLQEDLKKSREEAASYLNQIKRLKADFENYKKRINKESKNSFKSGEKELARGLVYILDNLERALNSKEIDSEGIEIINREFYNILKARGLRKMNSLGADFDPHCHHALSFIVSEDDKSGKVVDVIQPGYYWENEVLRPAQVVVGKAEEQEE